MRKTFEIKGKWRSILEKTVDPECITGISPIVEGGSSRDFFRIFLKDESVILVDTTNPDEFRDHIRIGNYLAEKGIPVPRLLGADTVSGVALFSDCGRTNLQNAVSSCRERGDREGIISLYKRVIDALCLMNFPADAETREVAGGKDFDPAYYLWESDYFLEHGPGRLFPGIVPPEKIRDEFRQLAETVSAEPRFFVHRDFQSQNIIFEGERPHFIDYQSARTGSIFYDAASLLRDPYVELTPPLQEELLDYHYDKSKSAGSMYLSRESARRLYNLISIQRLLQAIGAYGNLGLNRNKKWFLQYAEPAIRLLHDTLKQVEGMPILKDTINQILSSL